MTFDQHKKERLPVFLFEQKRSLHNTLQNDIKIYITQHDE